MTRRDEEAGNASPDEGDAVAPVLQRARRGAGGRQQQLQPAD